MPYRSVSEEETGEAKIQAEAQSIQADAQSAKEMTSGHLLRQAKRLLDQAQVLVEQAVIAERAKGTSWETIGKVLDGVTKSAAQKRYGARYEAWTNSPEMRRALGAYGIPKYDIEVGLPYGVLRDEWKAAGQIVDAQGLIAELNNATTALSGDDTSSKERSTWSRLEPLFLYTNSERLPAHAPRLPHVHYFEDAESCRAALSAWTRLLHQRETSTADSIAATEARASERQSAQTLEARVATLERLVELLMTKETGKQGEPPSL